MKLEACVGLDHEVHVGWNTAEEDFFQRSPAQSYGGSSPGAAPMKSLTVLTVLL